MTHEDCPIGAEMKSEVANLKVGHQNLHEVDENQWTAINGLRNRLPVWATFLVSGLTAAVAVLATLLAV